MNKLNIGGLCVPVPIVQGGMGVGVSLSSLASAVAIQGGVGVISCAGLGLIYHKLSQNYKEASILGLKEELRKAREKTRGIIGVNIMTVLTNFADMVKTSVSEKVDIIFSGAGMPLDLPSYLDADSITKLVPIVSSARGATVICEKWKRNYNYLPDAIVVEGPKAGGHLGYKVEQVDQEEFSLEHTIPEVVSAVKMYEELYNVKIPIIAAGGIYNGHDIDRIMKLGASGVQMGSRFVTTEECDASIEFKNTYINSQQSDIGLIKSPVGMPGRAIIGSFIHEVEDGKKQPKTCPFHCIKTCNIEKSPYCIMLALYNAYNGNMKRGYAFAGANAFRAQEITTVKTTFESLIKEYDEVHF